eukprot:scaffold99440_cov19-Tisochrysis_lutea.AAC.2
MVFVLPVLGGYAGLGVSTNVSVEGSSGSLRLGFWITAVLSSLVDGRLVTAARGSQVMYPIDTKAHKGLYNIRDEVGEVELTKVGTGQLTCPHAVV